MARSKVSLARLWAKKAGDVILIGRYYVLLRLYDFKVVGHAVGKAVSRLLERFAAPAACCFPPPVPRSSAARKSVKAWRTS